MKKILISIFFVTLAITSLAIENETSSICDDKIASEVINTQAENESKMSPPGDSLKADAVVSVPNKDKVKESKNGLKWVIMVSVIAAISFVVYRRYKLSKTVITFDSLVDYAELAKTSGAASVNAFILGSMPEEQQKQVMTKFNLGYKYKVKGYKAESTLVVVQMGDNGEVMDQIILCGHQFDEKLSIAFSNNTVLTINLK